MLGEILSAENVLDTPGDIFYATSAEVAAYFEQRLSAAELRPVIETRQAEWSEYRIANEQSPAQAYPAFLRGDIPWEGEPAAPHSLTAAGATAPAAETWQGRGVSPGQARGWVRVILDARGLGQIVPGEILVAPATDPGWTPVFGRLAGLVMERGGVLAHGAIVAREHHLPAVAGIPNITRELTDGDWVEVDGTRGIVRKVHK
jgi:pyruvate,water dikinase